MSQHNLLDLIEQYYQPTLSSTAKIISNNFPELGTANALRKRPAFISYYKTVSDNRTSKEVIDQDELPSIEQKIEQKCYSYIQQQNDRDKKDIFIKNLPTRPVGILNLGDPHLDDNNCNWPMLRSIINSIKGVDDVYGGNIGDTINNWVGRLAALYAKQSTTFEEALELSQWFANSLDWLYWVMGNHDHWNQGSLILKYLLREATVDVIADHESKIILRFENDVDVKFYVRHDWKGRSMYNVVHGLVKDHVMGSRWADICIGGHLHVWGLWQSETPDGVPRIAARIRGFKYYDDFALEKGFYNYKFGAAMLTIVDPLAPITERIKCYWDVPYGVSVLKMVSVP